LAITKISRLVKINDIRLLTSLQLSTVDSEDYTLNLRRICVEKPMQTTA